MNSIRARPSRATGAPKRWRENAGPVLCIPMPMTHSAKPSHTCKAQGDMACDVLGHYIVFAQ